MYLFSSMKIIPQLVFLASYLVIQSVNSSHNEAMKTSNTRQTRRHLFNGLRERKQSQRQNKKKV